LELATKLLIAISWNYGYLAGWTYLLKIYRKRFQFASKSIICNDAFRPFCEVNLKGKPVQRLRPPADVSSRLPQERSFRQRLELVGQRGEALEQQLRLRVPEQQLLLKAPEQQPLVTEKVSLRQLAEGNFPS
jgi:hypothetical protein